MNTGNKKTFEITNFETNYGVSFSVTVSGCENESYIATYSIVKEGIESSVLVERAVGGEVVEKFKVIFDFEKLLNRVEISYCTEGHHLNCGDLEMVSKRKYKSPRIIVEHLVKEYISEHLLGSDDVCDSCGCKGLHLEEGLCSDCY